MDMHAPFGDGCKATAKKFGYALSGVKDFSFRAFDSLRSALEGLFSNNFLMKRYWGDSHSRTHTQAIHSTGRTGLQSFVTSLLLPITANGQQYLD